MGRYRSKNYEPGMSGIEARKMRVIQAEEILKGTGPIPYTKAMAIVALNIGVSVEKAREYIRLLLLMGHLHMADNKERTVTVA